MGAAEYINIDLQIARVLNQLQGGGPDVLAAFFKALKKIHSYKGMDELRRDHGLNWEKLDGKFLPGTKDALYSFRITGNWRALCVLRSGPVIEVVAATDHDSAYY